MKVLLLNIDSKLPNIALEKIALYHKDDEIIYDPIRLQEADKVYVSCIFTKNKHKVDNYVGLRPDVIAGGTGYDMNVKLPPEIEGMKPKINYGFTTRGCIRKCPFCMVWQSEGGIKATGDIYDIWDRKSKTITLLDNNILAMPSHFKFICWQIREANLRVDFNQGLDIRLLTPELCKELKAIKTSGELRFAFDHPSLENTIREKVALLKEHTGGSRYFFYVLVGYNTTFDEDLHRCNVIKELGCRAYVMRYEASANEQKYIRLAAWANQIWTFCKYSFEDFCTKRYGHEGNNKTASRLWS